MRYSDRPDEQRVVVTGVGAITACGLGADALVEAACAGRSALRLVTLDDGRRVGGGPVDEKLLGQHGDVDKATALALVAAERAVADLPTEFRRQLYVFVSTGKPGMRLLERVHRDLLACGPAAIPRDFIRRVLPSAPGDAVAERFGCGGLRLAPIGACSTGLDAAALAARAIRAGRIRGALVGSAEASLTPLIVVGFERMGVLATREHDPARAMRPYARDRAGFLIGEGAGVLLLESVASAEARGAEILVELAGSAVVGDAHRQTELTPDGSGIAHAITVALGEAGLAPDEIAHINAHGTATKLNDLVETRAIRAAFGAHAEQIKICSTKPVTGHLLSASGSVELIVTIGAMRASTAPPTLNLDAADPACDLDYTPNAAVECSIPHALVLNYGFGGRVGAAVLGKWTGRRGADLWSAKGPRPTTARRARGVDASGR